MNDAAPSAAPDGRAELLDQLAYVDDELAMLAGVAPRLPEVLHTARGPEDADSLRTALARLATRDAARTEALRAGRAFDPEGPVPDAAIADAETTDTLDLIARARTARQGFVNAAEALAPDAFARSVPALHAAVLADAARWKTLAEQFFDARGIR